MPDFNLTDWLTARLAPGACCIDVKACVATELDVYRTAAQPGGRHLELLYPITPGHPKAWSVLWNVLIPHLASCHNDVHLVPRIRLRGGPMVCLAEPGEASDPGWMDIVTATNHEAGGKAREPGDGEAPATPPPASHARSSGGQTRRGSRPPSSLA